MNIFISSSFSDHEFFGVLVHILSGRGHRVVSVSADLVVGEAITRHLRNSEVLIACMPVGDRINPNVFWEIGYGMGCGVPTVIVGSNMELPISHLREMPFIVRSGDPYRDALAVATQVDEMTISSPVPVTEFATAEATLLAAVRDNWRLEAISPLRLEELVASLFAERGFDVRLSKTKDGGVDIILMSKGERDVVAVEVKKLNRQTLVSVDAVRRLAWTLQAVGANHGLLVTTSGFTAAATSFASTERVSLCTIAQLLEQDQTWRLSPKTLGDLREPRELG